MAGLQESFSIETADLLLPLLGRNYRMAQSQTDPKSFNDNTIIYNARYLQLLEKDLLWLSDTPRVPNTRVTDFTIIRTVTISRFGLRLSSTPTDSNFSSQSKSSAQLLVFNTHGAGLTFHFIPRISQLPWVMDKLRNGLQYP